ncbi:ABC transporter-like protein [Caballeronia hypogeia]|uniref:ABC transporter-like protein n=1 Tax=Caballeronia hypogeia TaxID=1777140 RepID=A0A158AGC5_9BURK|nr:ABC transporter ATP-binding protein [Caballeronia hypogeia]SAK56097.1 ABC transporter-like protein [Caballeronia hypogeia]
MMKTRSGAAQLELGALPQQDRVSDGAAAGRASSQVDMLRARGAVKRFGGIAAVDDVTLELTSGEIHGLIGPNGSGKTTMLNLLSGYYPLDGGEITLNGANVTQSTVQARTRLGLARTFQKPRLLETLSVLDNATLGSWNDAKPGFIGTALAWPAQSRRDAVLRERARQLLIGVGLGAIADKRANLLDHAQQRFLEIARALAMRPRFILLDEPAGGLTEREIEMLGDILLAVRECGIGVLVVEHHTDFVFRVCDRVSVLNLGRTLASGAPGAVRNDPEVIRVYLGA